MAVSAADRKSCRSTPFEFAGLEQWRDDGIVLRTRIMFCEERIFAVQCDKADGALDAVRAVPAHFDSLGIPTGATFCFRLDQEDPHARTVLIG